nr:hypothetical protein KitaXyl93_23420 [Kitasatospora sp. Xyl93]
MAEAAATLYGLPPSEFTVARDAAVTEARRSGDRQLAARIKALHRPTVAAYALNRLVRDDRGEVGEVLELGEALRRAQARLAGTDLRELSTRRHRLVAALTARASDAASASGVRLSEAQLREVEQSLRAALADADAAEALAGGCLAAALEEPSVLPGVPAESAAGPPGREARSRSPRSVAAGEREHGSGQTAARQEGRARREREAKRRREQAEAALAAARHAHEVAVRDRDRLERQVQHLAVERNEASGRVERAWVSLDAALKHAEAAGKALAESEAERDAAETRAEEALRHVQEATMLLDAEGHRPGGRHEGER